MIKEQSAGTVLFIEESMEKLFLLLHYPTGHWDFVKGKIENNESLEQAAIRETKEETGIIDIEFIKGFKEKIEYSFKFNGDIVQKEVIFFLAKTNTKQVKISDEHLDYVWLDFNNALNKITYENAKNVLKKSKNYLEKLC
ncbi:MAG: NUDIX domain-containing protein [Nitrosopumilales archaeon]|nr:NUDIX domain-containing protein [Nitrosopumilales archaeon]